MSMSITGASAGDPAGVWAAAGAFRAESTYSRATDIVIETLEGDRVTLSASAYAAGGCEAYGALAVGGGAAAWQSGASAWSESGGELNLSVSGDLSARELADFHLHTVDEMIQKASDSGDHEKAAKQRDFRDGLLAGMGKEVPNAK